MGTDDPGYYDKHSVSNARCRPNLTTIKCNF
ncbi:hypothetical protein T07_15103 [Trichinella nelsoni]|uniref:Uncharacterized protein n=1 Tax=Trichinella nelsoni TaxID=6336 RepID=A0A0V0RCR3_9BILA|nr:hypothetical protein T07_15103 [Trichinella nelsoni]